MYKKILLPTDGSEYANKAAEHAIWIAHASGAEIIALNVIETSSLVGLPAEDLIVRIKEMLKEEGKIALVGSADEFLAKKYDLGGQLTEDLDIECHGQSAGDTLSLNNAHVRKIRASLHCHLNQLAPVDQSVAIITFVALINT